MADDSSLHKSGKKYTEIKGDLKMDFMILHKWFDENNTALNPGKSHYININLTVMMALPTN